MSQLVKIKCNGPDHHVNEIDLDKVLEPTTVLRGREPARSASDIPERVVRPCRYCAEGRVILTRRMIEEIRGVA